MQHKTRGFTLIELMIVVAILAVIAVYAYTNYARYGFRSRRSDGQQYLMQVAAAEERYFTAFNVYNANLTGTGSLGFTVNTSTRGYYTVTVTLPTTTSYTLTATPGGSQANDVCGNLTLDNQGNKTPTPSQMPQNSNGNCW
jgi:type IV pilus assembly protein PilE